MGQYLGQRLANDPAYRATVNNAIAVLNACNANPAACTQQAIRAAALVLAPLMGVAGISLTPAAIGIGGGLGSVANIFGQLAANGGQLTDVNSIDAALAGVTGAVTWGSTLIPSLFFNTSGALVAGAANSTAVNNIGDSMYGAAAGTLFGYPVGTFSEGFLNSVLNPWYRNQWRDIGLTIQQWRPPTRIPSVGGAVGSGLTQELVNGGLNDK